MPMKRPGPVKLSGIARWLRHRAGLAWAPLSIGVRAMVEDGEGALLLVKHTYMPGWHFPGGGVDPGETVEEAVDRELGEEAGLRLTSPPALIGIFLNRALGNRDHVLLFRCSTFERFRDFIPNFEIAQSRFFGRLELPPDVSHGTRRRLDEIAGSSERSSYW